MRNVFFLYHFNRLRFFFGFFVLVAALVSAPDTRCQNTSIRYGSFEQFHHRAFEGRERRHLAHDVVGRVEPHQRQNGKNRMVQVHQSVYEAGGKNIWCIFKDSRQNIWASATNEGTLYRFNRETQQFEVFDRRLSDLLCLTQTKDGKDLVRRLEQPFLY